MPSETNPSGGLLVRVALVEMHTATSAHYVTCAVHQTLSFLHYCYFFFPFISGHPLHPSAYLPSSSTSFLYRFRHRLLNLPFRDVTGCHGNCLGGRGRCSNLSVRQCCQATGHMAFPSNNTTAGTCQSS